MDAAVHDRGHVVGFTPESVIDIAGICNRESRAVTPDLEGARSSAAKCLEVPFEHVCAGHRNPLRNAAAERERFKLWLANINAWPMFG